MVKLNGYIVTAIESDIILPSTERNARKYGGGLNARASANSVMASFSLLYDCINKFAIDTFVGPYKRQQLARLGFATPPRIERNTPAADHHCV